LRSFLAVRSFVLTAAGAIAALTCANPSGAQDRASGARDLAALEAGIVEELNRARTDPAGLARDLEALVPLFEGTLMRLRGALVQTREGVNAVLEAIVELRATQPMAPLQRSAGLSAAARDLAADQGLTGAVGHQGSDGSTPSTRANRHGTWGRALSENVSYGKREARDAVIQLLVDDGVPGRGHRRNLLDPDMRFVGVACAPHPRMDTVCVMDHARDYREGR
jgi:uncharacterized protein YkwD